LSYRPEECLACEARKIASRQNAILP
jgi:hypothetical protein